MGEGKDPGGKTCTRVDKIVAIDVQFNGLMFIPIRAGLEEAFLWKSFLN